MILGFGRHRAFDVQRWLETVSYHDAVWLLKARWKLLALFAATGLGGAAAYNLWNPQQYLSRATVRFIPPQVSAHYFTSNVAMQVDQRIFAVTQVIKSRLTAGKLIEGFQLYPHRRKYVTVADLVPVFQQDLDFKPGVPPGGAELKAVPSLVISYRYPDADKAQKVVQRIVEIIYEENRRYRSDQSLGTTDFFQQEVKTVTARMRELEQKLGEFPPANVPGGDYRTSVRLGRVQDLERRLADLRRQMDLSLQNRNLRQASIGVLEEQVRGLALANANPARPLSAAADRMQQQAAALSGRLEELTARYKPGHPDLELAARALAKAQQDLAKQIEQDQIAEQDASLRAARAQLAQAQAEYAGYEATLQASAREAEQLVRQIAELRAQSLPGERREAEHLNLMREYQVVRDHYQQLEKRRRESELASDMERRGHGETVELVEPPTVPGRAEYPNNWMRIGLGAAGGFGLGYLLALALFLRAPRVRTAGHLEILGPVPVLACLPAGRPAPSASRLMRPVQAARALLPSLLVLAALGSGCARGPAAARQWAAEADQALRDGDYRRAVILYQKSLREDPRWGEGYRRFGEAHLAAGHLAPAVEQLARAAELAPADAALQERVAELVYQGYFSDPSRPLAAMREAEHRAERLMDRWPGRPSGYRLKAQILMELHRGAEAQRLLEQALERMEDGSLRAQLAAAYYRSGDYGRAERQLDRCLEATPRFSACYDLLYLQRMERGRTREGRRALAAKWEKVGGLDAGLQLAAHDYASGEAAAAEVRLAELAEQFAREPAAYARIGDFWLHRGLPDRAAEWYQAGKLRGDSERSLYAGRLAELWMARRQPEAARQLIAAELKAAPGDPLLNAYQAAFEAEGSSIARRKQLQTKLEMVMAQMPNSSFVRLHLGRAYLLNGDVVRASEQLRNCVNLDPNYAPGWLALAETELAAGDVTAAGEHLGTLLRRAPDYAPARLLQAKVNLAQRRGSEAQQSLERLLEADPSNVEALLLLARAKAADRQRGAAEQLLDRVTALRPSDFRPALLRARMELQAGESRQALERLKQAAGSHPDSVEIASLLGSAALMAGDYPLAQTCFRDLTARYADQLEFRLGLASSLAMSGRQKDAESEFRRIQAKSEGDERPWLLYGALMAEAGNPRAAMDAYQEALRRESRNPYVLNNLAYLMARTGQDLQKALQLAESARRTKPHSAEIHDTLAYIYVRLGMRRNAVTALEQLLYLQGPRGQQRVRRLMDRIASGDLAAVQADMERSAIE